MSGGLKAWAFAKPTRMRRFMNVWPPFLFAGIYVQELSEDYTFCRVKLRAWVATRNVNGSQFGGNLFAMTDPIYPLMLLGIFGKEYFVWDKEATIEFIKPAFHAAYFECRLNQDEIAAIKQACADGNKHFPVLENHIVDAQGNVLAKVKRTLYIRLKPEYRPQQS